MLVQTASTHLATKKSGKNKLQLLLEDKKKKKEQKEIIIPTHLPYKCAITKHSEIA